MSILNIIDSHLHFWDLSRNYYPWLCDANAPDHRYGNHKAIKRNHLPADYKANTAGSDHSITATVHCEAVCEPANAVAETEWLNELRGQTGMPTAAVGYAVFDSDDIELTLAAHSRYPFMRGIRYRIPLVSHSSGEENARPFYDSPKFLRGFGMLEQFGMSCDIAVPFRHLVDAADLAHRFSRTQFILNHCGGPHDRSEKGLEAWQSGIDRLAKEPNVAVKVSGIGMPDQWTSKLNAPIMRATIKTFGVDRCLFASNFPPDSLVADFATILKTTKSVVDEFPQGSREKIFSENARRIYRLP